MFSWLKRLGEEDRVFKANLARIIGCQPKNLGLYKLALSHNSVAKMHKVLKVRESNERLEYLGDAILGAIVAEHLFKKFPREDEGFLTEIRSRLVNRESLNQLSQRAGLSKLVRYCDKRRGYMGSMYGDALEAMVGAVYLDRGYKVCKTFVLERLLADHFDLKEVIKDDRNFKSRLIEWSQRENKAINFEVTGLDGDENKNGFVACVTIDSETVATGSGHSKKKAEQAAAKKAWAELHIVQS